MISGIEWSKALPCVSDAGAVVHMILSPRFEHAMVYASILHSGQARKGTGTPYISHLLAVASLVLENGGTEDEAIAALLHDAVEDAGGKSRLDDIRNRFGDAVAQIVQGCTDADTLPKPPWKERKTAYLAHLREASASVRLVSAADKVHNARSILIDYRRLGEGLWGLFKGGKDGTLWYYRELVRAFQDAGSTPLVEELVRIVTELERMVAMDHRR
jgi:GTP pyrophosphokinase